MTPNPEPHLKMYIVINRSFLPLPNCAVQSSHAVAEYMERYGHLSIVKDWVNNHKTMILLNADIKDMSHKMDIMHSRNKSYQCFYEPDIGNLLTAIAFEPMLSEEGKEIFGDLKLLK